jgi:uncharacterized protein (DUF2384 family)
MFKDKLMPGSKLGSAVSPAGRPIRSTELVQLLNTVVDDPEKWLATPSVQFGGRKPDDLVGTAEESKIFDLLYAVDQGLF